MKPLSIITAGGAAMLAACAYSPTRYPVTQHGRSFTEHDAAIVGRAPAEAGAVDSARIARAAGEPQNWLTYYGRYHAQRYSGLDQIHIANVRNLRPAWIFQAGVIGLIANPASYSFEVAPIVVDGTMFVSGWDGYVWALDAANGPALAISACDSAGLASVLRQRESRSGGGRRQGFRRHG